MSFEQTASGRLLLLVRFCALRLRFFAAPALLFLCALPLRAEPVDDLVARASALNLASDPQWLKLGHWEKSLFGGRHSLAQGTEFFLARDGARDPKAELEATLRALYGQVPLTPDQVKRGIVPAQCRFPARAVWLAQRLAFNPPAANCERLADYFMRLAPQSASIVFSSYYMNNPASAFGHTFLRIHRRDDAVAAEKRELLDTGIDYSAAPDTSNPLFYAVKGLFGMFKGEFHRYPYYYKIREYNDYESRDLWEYELDLSPQELWMLCAHIFELGSAWFPYYYTRENCSYLILAALEAVAPRLHLLEAVKWPVLPADTVKALFHAPGLVRDVRYRPSAMTQLRARIAGMPREQIRAVERLAKDPETPLVAFAPEQQIRIFDAAADLVDVRYAKQLVAQPEGEGGKLKQRILERRALILLPSPELQIPPPLDKRPDRGHGSGRVDASAGASSDGGGFAAVGFRLALHDLADPPAGYPELSQIQFFPSQLRFYPGSNSLEVERVDFLDAISLHAMSALDTSLSWRVRAGAQRLRDGGCNCLAGGFELGSGLTLATDSDRLAIFALGNFRADSAPSLQGLHAVPALRAGVGPMGGVRLRLWEDAVFVTEAAWTYFPAAISRTSWSVESSLRLVAFRSFSLGLDGRLQPNAQEASLTLYAYY
jgi:hypothetical protein